MSLTDELNEQQRAAVLHPGGPMLILAGAGSGKTRVITRRVAHLLATGVPPQDIVAVTFTNKAAGEMRARVLRLLGHDAEDTSPSDPRVPWMGTFHAFCLRLLRFEVASTGLQRGFLVYDQDDARALVKSIQRELHLEEKVYPPARIASRISRLKADCVGPDEFHARRADLIGEAVEKVYPIYQSRLVQANACDFDDLLMRTVLLLESNADVREKWQGRVRHLLVDEYQDTNRIQYRLIRLLAGSHRCVCAVGDEDQSIYRFRGAEIGNILRFEEDFPGTAVFRVERNYRSTGNILAAADGVVSHNLSRKGKVLWTDNEDGEPVTVHSVPADMEEAEWVARQATLRADECGWDEVAVAYRTNAQSRLFEEAFARRGIPHAVIGGLRFYERKEVKDVLAYLRLVANPHDDVALERVLNVPTRGIGRGAQDSVRALARERGVSLWTALVDGTVAGSFTGRVEKALEDFATLVEELRSAAQDAGPAELTRQVMERTDYFTELLKEGPEIAADRRANLAELVSAAAQHETRDPESGLVGFLSQVALASDTDKLGAGGRVQLMTLHSAKGLEFDTVFMVGMEEGLFPHSMTQEVDDDLEEERRLCYVGMTRARRHLFLSHAGRRRVFGIEKIQHPSRFLAEIPPERRRVTGVEPRPAREEYRPTHAVSRGGVGGSSQAALSSFFPDAEIAYEEESQDEAVTDPIRKGDDVRHARYGIGKVLMMEGRGDDAKLTVYFASKGRRVLLQQRFAKLEKVR